MSDTKEKYEKAEEDERVAATIPYRATRNQAESYPKGRSQLAGAESDQDAALICLV